MANFLIASRISVPGPITLGSFLNRDHFDPFEGPGPETHQHSFPHDTAGTIVVKQAKDRQFANALPLRLELLSSTSSPCLRMEKALVAPRRLRARFTARL